MKCRLAAYTVSITICHTPDFCLRTQPETTGEAFSATAALTRVATATKQKESENLCFPYTPNQKLQEAGKNQKHISAIFANVSQVKSLATALKLCTHRLQYEPIEMILRTLALSGRQGAWGGAAESIWWPVHSRGLLGISPSRRASCGT